MYDFSTQQDFEQWVAQIPDKIKSLSARLNGTLDLNLSGDLDSVKILSEWILEKFESYQDVEKDPVLWDELSCYVGEVYRQALDSQWAINLDPNDSKDVYFGEPVIVCNPPPPISPMSSITTLVDRKKSTFILESIEKRLRNKK